jgi:hypothetical protein
MSTETLIWLAIMLLVFGVVWLAAPYHRRPIDATREDADNPVARGNTSSAQAYQSTATLPEQGPGNQGREPGKSDDTGNLSHGPQHYGPNHGRESRVLH